MTRSGRAASSERSSSTATSSPVGSLGLHSATIRVRSLTARRTACAPKPGTGTACPRARWAMTGYRPYDGHGVTSSSSGSSSACAAAPSSCAAPSPTTRRSSATPSDVGELGAQRGGMAVEVAVQPAPRRVGDRVDHRRGRVLGPRGRAEVERLDPGEGLLLALVGLGAQVGADLLLGHALELPVVAEHQCGASDGPRPPMNSNQMVKHDAPMTAVVANTAPDDALTLVVPRRPPGQDPEAIDALEHGEAAEEQHEQQREAQQDAPPDRVGAVLDLRGEPQAERRDRPPEQQVDDDHEGEHRVGHEAVDAPTPRTPGLRLRAIARRRGAGTAADEQAAGVGGIGTQGGLG